MDFSPADARRAMDESVREDRTVEVEVEDHLGAAETALGASDEDADSSCYSLPDGDRIAEVWSIEGRRPWKLRLREPGPRADDGA